MANVYTTQLLEDGPRNAIIKVTGLIDTADEPYTIILNPASLSSMTTDGYNPPQNFMMRQMVYNIEDGFQVRLWWDDASSVAGSSVGNAALIESLTGRGFFTFERSIFIRNNAPIPTGKVGLSTSGMQSGTPLSYSITLWMVKKDTLPAGGPVGPSLSFNIAANSQYLGVLSGRG